MGIQRVFGRGDKAEREAKPGLLFRIGIMWRLVAENSRNEKRLHLSAGGRSATLYSAKINPEDINGFTRRQTDAPIKPGELQPKSRYYSVAIVQTYLD